MLQPNMFDRLPVLTSPDASAPAPRHAHFSHGLLVLALHPGLGYDRERLHAHRNAVLEHFLSVEMCCCVLWVVTTSRCTSHTGLRTQDPSNTVYAPSWSSAVAS